MAARPLLVFAALLACVAAGCGNERTPIPETEVPDAPAGERVDRYPKSGITLTAPVNWTQLQAQGLRVGGLQSKRATLAIWRYQRAEPLPETDAELARAEQRLIDQVAKRDPSFKLKQSKRLERGGAPAIELIGRQTIAGLPYGVRSSHVFFADHELVFDGYAPPEHFDRVDRTVFVPVLGSLKLKAP